MNEDPEETRLENALRRLAPAAPSPALIQGVDEELKLDMNWLGAPSRPRRKTGWLHSTAWAALGAAAAVTVMSYLPGTAPDAPATATTGGMAAAPMVLPISTIREWEDVRNDGIHYSRENVPEQHLRVLARERQTWIDPRDGAEMTVEYPREQKVVLPVSFQ
ncbi:MAG: hypothetical protein R3F13_17145 [Prosthecobacter sp.]